jgi:4-hydroxy-2-oxoglutarate aldolase
VIVAGASSDVAVAASRHPNVAAVVACDAGMAAELAKHGIPTVAGSSANLASTLQAGATSAILSCAAAAPYSTITIWEATRTREIAAAEDWQRRIAAAVDLVEAEYGIAGLKHAMDVNGYYGGPPRLPLLPIHADAKAKIEKALEGLKG